MKSLRYLSIVVSVTLFFGCSRSNKPAKPIDVGTLIESPVALDDAMLTLTVSDLHGFLDGAGKVAAQVSPMMGSPMIKMMLGGRLGDPQLAGFAQGKGFAVVMLDPENVFAVAEVDAARTATYVQSLQTFGQQAKTADGLVLIAGTVEQLTNAEEWAKTVQTQLLDAKRSPTIRIAAKPAGLIAENEELISSGLQQMMLQMTRAPASAEMAGMQKVFEAELHILLSLGRQIDAVEITVEPLDGSIVINEVIEPLADTRLSELLNAPVRNDFNPELQAGMFKDQAIRLEFCLRNPDALATFLEGESTALLKEMELGDAWAVSYIDYMRRWMNVLAGTVCESALNRSGKSIDAGYLIDVNDEDQTLELLRNLPADLATVGLFDLYASMGMPMSVEFKENVRTHLGEAIHQIEMDISMEAMSVEQRAIMESILKNMTFDVALCEGALVYTMGEGNIEKMIARLKNPDVLPVPLTARTAFPKGGLYYMDFDIGGYLSFITELMGETPGVSGLMQKFAEAFNGAEPITTTAYCNSGRLKSCLLIPGDLLVRGAKVGQMMAMEAMMQQQPVAAPQVEKKEVPAGGNAPDATLNLLDGTTVQLSEHIGGQVVVLDFWASWCGPCRKGLPAVQQTADQFAGADVVFYAINLREDKAAIQIFFNEAGLTLPVVMDDGTLGEAFGVSGIPHTVVIGKDGVIQTIHSGLSAGFEAQLAEDITAALAE